MINKLTEDKLAKMIWIGGSPCSGKSTCVESFAKVFNPALYLCDDYFWKHMEKADSSVSPALHRLKSMTWNDIWMRPVEVLLQDEIQIYYEEFEMIILDLIGLDDTSPLIIVEGTALLPELMKRIGVKKDQVLYLLPTKEFQYEKYSKREFIKGILKECDNPEVAFKNWMERDHELSKYIIHKAMELDYSYIMIDGSKSLDGIFEEVKFYFQGILPDAIHRHL